MAVATSRADGWPLVTLVGYVNGGFLLYCFVAGNLQKCVNIDVIAACRRHRQRWAASSGREGAINVGQGMDGNRPERIDTHQQAAAEAASQYAAAAEAQADDGVSARILPQRSRNLVALLRIEPEIFSLLDYSKGVGHSDLITFSERDLDLHVTLP